MIASGVPLFSKLEGGAEINLEGGAEVKEDVGSDGLSRGWKTHRAIRPALHQSVHPV
jgi:hypothetical protein